jgi:phosphoglycerate dehydrogenase-like enzyme
MGKTVQESCVITMGSQGQSYDSEILQMKDLGIDAVWKKTEIAGSLDPQTVIRHCKGYTYAITGGEIWDETVFRALKDSICMVVRHGVGYENVDIDTAARYGIPVAILPGANAPAVAELALGLMLSVIRRIPEKNTLVHAGQGKKAYCSTHSLYGTTVGFLGMGNIARALVPILHGFRCRLLAYDPREDTDFARENGINYAPMEEVLGSSDVVTLHMPLTPQTKYSINRDTLSLMKPGAIIINTSRGGLIKSVDLAQALREGRVAGAGLDVFENELEDRMGSEFYNIPNVVLTPHIASATFEIYAVMMSGAIDAINKFRSGLPIPGLLNPDYIKHR